MDFLRSAVGSRILAILTTGLLAVSACGPASQPGPTGPTSAPAATTKPAATTAPAPATQATSTSAPAVPAPTAPAGQPKQGGRVILGEFADAKSLNPVTVTDVPSDVVTSRIYAALLTVDAK